MGHEQGGTAEICVSVLADTQEQLLTASTADSINTTLC
jgi:hypothetical protein